MPRNTRHLGTAETVSIETDEDGFELHITNDYGDQFIVNVHPVLGKLLEEVTENLLRYLDEGDKARMAEPISNRLNSIHADLYDMRAGK